MTTPEEIIAYVISNQDVMNVVFDPDPKDIPTLYAQAVIAALNAHGYTIIRMDDYLRVGGPQ